MIEPSLIRPRAGRPRTRPPKVPKPRPTGYRCAFCGELGHNRQTCSSAGHTPKLLTERLATLKAEKHPQEWERLELVRLALKFVSGRRRDATARAVAALALEAMSW